MQYGKGRSGARWQCVNNNAFLSSHVQCNLLQVVDYLQKGRADSKIYLAQARPIDLSDMSDPEFDSGATTDGESDRPATRVSAMDGADERQQDQDSQITLSDSAFASQALHPAGESQETRGSRLRRRKDAYRAAKQLAGSGWGNDFVIVSSNASYDDEEIEL